MPRRRRQRSWLLAATLAASGLLHPVAGSLYERSRDPYRPRVFVELAGAGAGVVHVVGGDGTPLADADDCAEGCELRVDDGARVRLVATPGEGSTFEGWQGPCGPQSHRLLGWARTHLLLAADADTVTERAELFDFLAAASEATPPEWPLECELAVDTSTRATARFGEMPDEVPVEWIAEADIPNIAPDAADDELTITLPDPAVEAENLFEPEEELPPEEEPEPVEIAAAEPPPPAVEVQPPPPEPPPPTPPQPEIPKSRMKSVEVPDENEVEEAPDDATFLSDKNRDVAEETHATETNLERASEGERPQSEKSDVVSEDVGAEEDVVAALEETEASALEVDRAEETAHSGEDQVATGVRGGEEGQGGDEGEGGDDTPAENKGVLAMRGIEGRGAPGGPTERDLVDEGAGAAKRPGDGGARGRPGTRGRPGIETRLDQQDYERIVGTDLAENEREVARRKMSKRKGRWEKKLGAIQSSLENFTPEVRPGNQTALKTRAAPFAVFVNRMHRRIHELWGFGFLEDLDDKPASHELNDWNLATKIEVVLNPDGTVDKMTIVKPSGVLPFDVAAMDVIYTASPYEAPPEAIRSADGKVYLHWAFHRDWQQCGTFNVQPFILDNPPKNRDQGVMNDGDMLGALPRRPAAADTTPGAAAATARATSNLAAPDDPKAEHVANLWLSGFATGNVDKLTRLSKAPFRSGGRIVGQTEADIRGIYRTVLSETRGRIRDWALLSPAGYRKRFGSLPSGFSDGGGALLMVLDLGKERFTLALAPEPDGEYRVVGLER